MESLLARVATFLLENIASTIIDKGQESLLEWLSNKELIESDQRIRNYLIDCLPAYEYEKIDEFLSKEGIYSHNQTTTNWSMMSAQTDRIIDDFYNSYPSLRHNRENLSPLLKQAIHASYQSVISQLSIDGKVLYAQALNHREQSRLEHLQLENKLNKIQALLSQSSKKLSYTEVIKAYDILCHVIDSANFESINPLIQLMENQVNDCDRSYCSALKIYLYGFVGTKSELEALCMQYIRENPPSNLTDTVATFLLQMEQRAALRILHPNISRSTLWMLVNDYIAEDPNNAVKNIIDKNGNLKDEYATCEAALWIFANYSKKFGNKAAALAAYSQLNQMHSTVWTNWSIQETTAMLTLSAAIMDANFDISKIRYQAENLKHFSIMFGHLCNDLCVEYVDVFLSCAELLPFEEFDTYYKHLSLHAQELPLSKKHWYYAHFQKLDSIDDREFQSFCKNTNDENLMSIYLLYKSTDSAKFVIDYIEENKNILQKEYNAVVAYHNALSLIKGKEAAFEIVTSISIPKAMAFSYNVCFASFGTNLDNDKADSFLQAAVDEALNPTGDITIIHLHILINLLLNKNRWLDASSILKQYQDIDPSIMLLRLKILIEQEHQFETCSILIEKLETYYKEHDFVLYSKGIVAEQNLPGSGMEFLVKAFYHNPNPQYAYAALASRLNRNVYIEDDILSYAAKHDNVDLLYISGITYAKHGKNHKSFVTWLQALINSSNNYDERLYSVFMGEQLGSSEHNIPPDAIKPGTCCILVEDGTDKVLKIWIHDESITIPVNGSNFAGYEHMDPNDTTALRLLDSREGDMVILSNCNYKITEINYGDVIATRHCMQQLIEHGVLKQINVAEDSLDAFFEKVRELGEAQRNHVHDVVEQYRIPSPGLTLELFAQSIGQPYYKVVYALIHDSSIPLWAGTDGRIIDKDCILTPSTIAILSSIDIHPPINNNGLVKFYVSNSLNVNLELQAREHRNDKTTAVLGFEQDGHPYMIQNSLESKRNLNNYFACLKEWANWAHVLDPVLPNDYPSDIRSIAREFGIPNVEAIVNAQTTDRLICCDDLLLRKYMSSIGIGVPTTIDVMITLDYSFDSIINNVIKLIDCHYVFPITLNFLKWVSHCFENTPSREILTNWSFAIRDLLKRILSNTEMRTYFYQIYQESHNDIVTLHPELIRLIYISIIDWSRHVTKPEKQDENS